MHQQVDAEDESDIREYFFIGLLPDGSCFTETNLTDEQIAQLVSEMLRQGGPIH